MVLIPPTFPAEKPMGKSLAQVYATQDECELARNNFEREFFAEKRPPNFYPFLSSHCYEGKVPPNA